MNKEPNFILGLTGSIAMGKTTISNIFQSLGIPVWCADNEVNNLYKKNGTATQVISKEYPSVVTEIGVDKNKLRALIHKDNSLLKKIEKIVHPLLEQSKIDFITSNIDSPIIVFDIPLLLEKKQEGKFNAVLVVTASEKTQKDRVLRRKNINEKDFQLIKNNQLNEQEKLKKADFVINTEKSLSETKRDVLKILDRIKDSLR